MKDLWFKLSKLHNGIAGEYYYFSKRKKSQLFEDFNIDCGNDYADYLFDEAGLLDFYNGN